MRNNAPPPPFFNDGCASHFIFNALIPKVKQIIRNTWGTTLPNMKAIQPTVHKLWCPQVFWPSWKM